MKQQKFNFCYNQNSKEMALNLEKKVDEKWIVHIMQSHWKYLEHHFGKDIDFQRYFFLLKQQLRNVLSIKNKVQNSQLESLREELKEK